MTSQGKPVAGATVTATSSVLMHARVATTTANGTYWIESLPPGTYDVTFEHAHMTSLTRRAVIELARVARADASLDPSEEGDTVTSTATSISVADTQPVTSRASSGDLDQFPIWRTADEAAQTIAGSYSSSFAGTYLDDALAATPQFLGQDALEEVTVVRAAAPIESDWYAAIASKTRSGSNELSWSLRDTLTSTSWVAGTPRYDENARRVRGGGVDHFFEGTVGGAALPDRLWFFTSGWRGGEDDRALHNVSGFEAKLTSQLGAAHSLTAEYMTGSRDVRAGDDRAGSETLLQYTGALTPRTTIEAVAARSTVTYSTSIHGTGPTAVAKGDSLFMKASHLWSHGRTDSLLSVGGKSWHQDEGSSTTLFANDRWSSTHLIANVGGRLERGAHQTLFRPRVSATWDVGGDGRRALFAAFGSYAEPLYPDYDVHETSIGYANAIGSSGILRVNAAHREFGRLHARSYGSDVAHAESSYRLFERFIAGGFYEFVHQREDAFPPAPKHAANAWLSAQLPVGDSTIGVTLLERYASYGFSYGESAATDLALRYTLPVHGINLTTAADVTNVFNARRGEVFHGGRTVRVWFRVGK